MFSLNKKIKVSFPKVNLSKTHKHISLVQLLIVVGMVVAIGGYFLYRSYAEVPVVASIQAEAMSQPTGASIVSDSSASGSQALILTQNGQATTSISLPSDVSSITISAKATQCSGSPTMSLSVDGSTILANTSVSATSYNGYTANTNLAAGNHQISITGGNLATVKKGKKTCSRTLTLDVINFNGVAPAPVATPIVSLSASPTSISSGGNSTLTWTSSNATGCTASGGWTGSKAINGTETVTPTVNTQYAITCTGSGGSASASTSIAISSGTISNIPATIVSDCSVDTTQALLSWINSVPDNSTLSFASGKCYRIDGTVELRNRNGLVFEGNGATFKSVNAMTTGSATDDQRAMFRVIGSTKFIFRNMIITGSYTKGGTLDDTLQHAHGIDIRGTSAEIANTTISNVAGDCVYFGLGYDNVTRSTGSYHDSACTSIGRNGMAVTAGNNISAERNTISNVGFDAFDVEPNVGTYTNTSGWGSSSITVNNNTIKGYYRLYAYSIVTNAPNIDQYFTNNKVVGNGLRIGIVNPTGAGIRAKNVNITGNTADTATYSPAIEAHLVDILNITSNTVPMSSGTSTMTTADSSCKVTVSGNNFSAAAFEVKVTNPTTGC